MSRQRNSMKMAAAVKPRKKSLVREYAEAFLMAVVFTIIIRTFLVQAFRIPTGSMEDTLLIGDFLFVNKFIYGAKLPLVDVRLPKVRAAEAGDIIVFRYPKDPSKDYIKRCVAVAGQTVEIREKLLYVDGELRDEPFIKHTDRRMFASAPRDNYGPVTVPPGHLFMMGDNRDNSADSRAWGFLDHNLVKGKALFIYWSWNPERKLLGFLNTPRLTRIGDLVR